MARIRVASAVGALVASVIIAVPVRAALLGVQPGHPQIFFDSQGTLVYDAGSDLLAVSGLPVHILFAPGDTPVVVEPTGGPPVEFVELNVLVGASGDLIGGVPGDDLIVIGEIDQDGGGTPDFDGVLLTGEVLAFGSQNAAAGSTDTFDFRFQVTGGSLAPLFAGADVAIVVTSENSTFAGDFAVNFGGEAKGPIGPDVPSVTGACCADEGGCIDDLTQEQCLAQLGLYQGDGTTCEPGLCLPIKGACCFDDGMCAFVEPDECNAAGGAFEGENFLCSPGLCQPPDGACCYDSGECIDFISQLECNSTGGLFQGLDTVCEAGLCPGGGACCLADASCIETSQDECVGQGGLFQGLGTVCTPGLCPPIKGACCFDDGMCATVEDEECAAAGGDYEGDNTVCAPGLCPAPLGACCFESGDCLEIVQTECIDQGGLFQGAGTGCQPGLCPQTVTGACCFSIPQTLGACQVLTPDECDEFGGSYQGDDTVCDPNPCPTGACCIDGTECLDDVTAFDCVSQGGEYAGDGSVCVEGAADDVVFGVDDVRGTDSQLFSFNLTTGVLTLIGPVHEDLDLEAIARSNGGVVGVAGPFGGPNDLVDVDFGTGAVTPILEYDFDDDTEVTDMTSADGTIWAFLEGIGFATLGLDGSFTVVIEEDDLDIHGLAASPDGLTLYAMARNGRLYEVDVASGDIDEILDLDDEIDLDDDDIENLEAISATSLAVFLHDGDDLVYAVIDLVTLEVTTTTYEDVDLEDIEGFVFGQGSACPEIIPVGACCFDDPNDGKGKGKGNCEVIVEADCTANGGLYQGDGSSCDLCVPPPFDCGTAEGGCFEPNGTPGCVNVACCELICAADPFCCDTEWDSICALDAMDNCEPTAACPGSGSCFVDNGTPGCDEAECCQAVCNNDPFCCVFTWDIICAGLAELNCQEAEVCAGDLDGNGAVDVGDMVAVIVDWNCSSAMPGVCPGDANGDGVVDVSDMVFVIVNWGVCP